MSSTTQTNLKKSSEDSDFWLVYSGSGQKNTIRDAISALYYLPANFKLMILEEKISNSTQMKLASEITERIKYKTYEGLQNLAVFSNNPSAMIYDNNYVGDDHKPSVNVVNDSDKALNKKDALHYTVSSNSPEALASAALQISRIAA